MLSHHTVRNFALAAAIAVPSGLAPHAALAGQQDFRVTNNSNSAIVKVNISEVGQDSWGPNRLQNGAIEPGTRQSFNFTDVEGCVFDVRFVFADGEQQERRSANLCRIGNFTIGSNSSATNSSGQASNSSSQRSSGLQDFTMRNKTSTIVERVYISKASENSWGPDRLGNSQVIRPGDSHRFTFNGYSECLFDIKVVFRDGDSGVERGVDLCRVGTFNVN